MYYINNTKVDYKYHNYNFKVYTLIKINTYFVK